MNEKIMKRFKREIGLDACLSSIKECVSVARDYITGVEVNDVKELIVAFESVPEYIEEIKQLTLEMTEDYEEEIKELENEQL